MVCNASRSLEIAANYPISSHRVAGPYIWNLSFRPHSKTHSSENSSDGSGGGGRRRVVEVVVTCEWSGGGSGAEHLSTRSAP